MEEQVLYAVNIRIINDGSSISNQASLLFEIENSLQHNITVNNIHIIAKGYRVPLGNFISEIKRGYDQKVKIIKWNEAHFKFNKFQLLFETSIGDILSNIIDVTY